MVSSHHFLSLLLLLLLSLEYASLSSASRCHPDDEKALLEIKDHFNNPPSLSSWTPQTPCCRSWKGVICYRLNNSTIYRVNFLEIAGSTDINGDIPSSFGDLPYLETLICRNQVGAGLTGPIPPAIGKLTRLNWLSLNWNSITGPIPSFLSRLTNLSSLDLNDNLLTGSIPSFLGRLPNISDITLTNNQLTGPIPDTFGLLPTKSFLRLSNNKLSGKIPTSLGKVNFEFLELAGNQLKGDASFLFGEDKTELAHLDLSGNTLSFNLSKTVFPTDPLVSQLLVMDLSHNMIYGGIPSWLGQNTQLYDLNLSYNRLCGPIPTDGGKLQTFDPSVFSNNTCLCGAPLPACN